MTTTNGVQVLIRGRVQGVGYRAWFAGEARRRSLTGWVRNRRDGSVEAEIHGEAGALEQMISASRQGPVAARVDEIEQRPATSEAAVGFEVLPTV